MMHKRHSLYVTQFLKISVQKEKVKISALREMCVLNSRKLKNNIFKTMVFLMFGYIKLPFCKIFSLFLIGMYEKHCDTNILQTASRNTETKFFFLYSYFFQ